MVLVPGIVLVVLINKRSNTGIISEEEFSKCTKKKMLCPGVIQEVQLDSGKTHVI